MQPQFQYLPVLRQPMQTTQSNDDTTVQKILDCHIQGLKPHTVACYHTLLHHLEAFAGGDIPLASVDATFVSHFANHILQKTSPSSARTHIHNLKALLHAAARSDHPVHPIPNITTLIPSNTESDCPYLTYEEICRLQSTPCPHDSTRQAFLFAIHTGLRLSDIETLRWDDLRTQSNNTLVVKIQVKTRREVRIPIDNSALQILQHQQRQRKQRQEPSTNPNKNKNQEPDPHIFPLPSRTTIAKDLKAWAKAAQIDKTLTFHVSRHTFATLMITQGVGIYEVSQLCGHANVKTTERYARLLDSRRFEAIAALDQLFSKHA